jgi:choline dehydrogenase-like flavoprotein
MTPQILINSGIGGDDEHQDGDAETIAHQERKGPSKNTTHAILSVPKVKVHLPGVGKNLQDHPVVTMGFELDAEVALMGSVSSIYTIGSEMDEYFWSAMELNRLQTLNQSMYRSSANSKSSDEAQQSAILADLTLQLGTLGTPGFSAGCFLRSPYSDNDDSTPDIQITVFPRHMEPHVTRQTQQGTRDYLRLLRNKAMLVTVALLKPEARFEVKASMSSIPLVRFDGRDDVDSSCDQDSDETWKRILGYRLPEIDLPIGQKRYLTERDVQRLAWGLEQVRRIQAQPPLANHVGPEIYPGANVRGKELREYVRSKSLPNAHWAGSTRMSANTEDAMAVVDETLRVRNVRGLRIVDAGVLPTVPNGNLHSTVCVIAHRAATLIAAQAHEPTVS